MEHIADLSSSSDDEFSDEDTCHDFELQQFFQQKFTILDEKALSLSKDYILHLCSDSSFTRVVAGTSSGSVQVFDLSTQSGLTPLHVDYMNTTTNGQFSSTCGVRFLDETPNCLLVGTTQDGLVRLFDLRAQKEQARFISQATEGAAEGQVNSIACFDSNANCRVICTGTEQKENNVFLMFHDVRERKQMGSYSESHSDDITSLRFHDSDPDLLCSGSTDGLINVFNIEGPEDDALQNTINTEISVHKLNWHRNVYEKDIISCITHTNDLLFYECEEGDVVSEFKRSEAAAAIKRKSSANCNVIDAHNMQDNDVLILCGTNINKGEILRGARLQNKKLKSLANFAGNKQIVRASIYNPKLQTMMTAGESGIVSVWTPIAGKSIDASDQKAKTKSKSKRTAVPY